MPPEPEIVAVLAMLDTPTLRRVLAHAAGILSAREGVCRTEVVADRVVLALRRQQRQACDA